MNQPLKSIIEINELVKGGIFFKKDTPVWDSFFDDDIWEEKISGQSIVWSDYIYGKGRREVGRKAKYQYCLTQLMVNDLKVAAAIYALFPSLLNEGRVNKKVLVLASVRARVEDLSRIFSLMILEKLKLTEVKYNYLSDFNVDDLKRGISIYPGRPEALKRALKLISNPIIQKNISKPLQWSYLDIVKGSFRWKVSQLSEEISTLTDRQFLFLLEYSRRSVCEFLETIGEKSFEYDGESDDLEEYYDSDWLRGVEIREFLNKKINLEEASKRLGIKTKIFNLGLSDVQNSAMMIILLLTGMRASEVGNLTLNCLDEKYGYYFLKSKVVKNRHRSEPDVEGWLAVPLVLDAYKVLSMLVARVGGSYLFSPIHESFLTAESKVFEQASLNRKFNRWIQRIDARGVFENHRFSMHQCRETLVSQLAAQEVGLAFISMQLKHVHGQLNNMPNLVTASYGQYRAQLFSSVAKKIVTAKEDALIDIYGENAKLAGTGAVEQKVRIDAFFSGLGLFGNDRVKYIKEMARKGVKLMPTSIGSCTKSFIAPDGEKLPPCAGDYDCDPDCKSHVMTERHIHVIRHRKAFAVNEAKNESSDVYKEVWSNMISKFDKIINSFELAKGRDG